MGNFLNKLFGKTEDLYDDYDDDSYDDDDYGSTLQDDRVEDLSRGSSSRSDRPRRPHDRTVAFPGSRQPQKTGHEVILSDATSIDDAWSICDHVKAGRTVICNTERLTPEIRTRFQDVVSGSAYAIGGILQAVSQFIFIFAPSNAIIQYDEGRELFQSIPREMPRDYTYDNVYSEPGTSRFMR